MYRSFLRRAAEDVVAINADSDRVRLAADTTPGELCDRYAGHFSGIEHLGAPPPAPGVIPDSQALGLRRWPAAAEPSEAPKSN